MKNISMVALLALICVLAACASAPPPAGMKSTQEARLLPGEQKTATPRFREMEECFEYLWTALEGELYKLGQSGGFSAAASGGGSAVERRPLTPEEQVQQNSENALDELDREIARQEGRDTPDKNQPPVAISSGESYTTGESSNSPVV